MNLLSVNQMNAQAKLLDIWKAIHVSGNPLKVEIRTRPCDAAITLSNNMPFLKEVGISASCNQTVIDDASHIWDKAPECIKMCMSVYMAKKAIKSFIKTFPF